jgi:glycosyltransferase involved in cell wall biosynthesis
MGKPTKAHMKIGYVSTYPPMRCAIGVYTRQLATALTASHDDCTVTVFTERDVVPTEDDARIEVRPVYERDRDYVDDLENAIVARNCQLVHFQHAGDLLGEDERLPRLLQRLRDREIRTVVTLHTVYDEQPSRILTAKSRHADFYRAVGSVATQIVVHQEEGCATRLEKQRVARNKLTVIPHGTTRLNPPPRAESRKALELPEDTFLFTFFGFIHLQKNVHRIVEAFARIAPKHPKAQLLVSGMPWGDRWYNHLYVNLIKASAFGRGFGKQILIRDSYLNPELVSHIYGASDVILLPHNQTYGSASGVFHQAIGAGKPVLCAIGPKFVEAREALASTPELCIQPKNTRAWSAAMTQVLGDTELLERGRRAVQAYAAATEWSVVATRHFELYQSQLG